MQWLHASILVQTSNGLITCYPTRMYVVDLSYYKIDTSIVIVRCAFSVNYYRAGSRIFYSHLYFAKCYIKL